MINDYLNKGLAGMIEYVWVCGAKPLPATELCHDVIREYKTVVLKCLTFLLI